MKRTYSCLSNNHIKIFEVSLRDGFQNVKKQIQTEDKLKLLSAIQKTGIKNIELTSFVSPKAIPQFYDSEIISNIVKEELSDINYSCLVPNEKGMNKAIEYNYKEIAIFTSPSDEFNKKNINCSVDDSFIRFEPIIKLAQPKNIKIRGYVSCIIKCPYNNNNNINNDKYLEKIGDVVEKLLKMNVYEISLGDTTGVGYPYDICKLLNYLINIRNINPKQLALHCHDTNARAIDNIETALEYGIKTIDSSIGGLGGCPYAKNASGNVDTYRVVSTLHSIGYDTGIDLDLLNECYKIAKDIKYKYD